MFSYIVLQDVEVLIGIDLNAKLSWEIKTQEEKQFCLNKASQSLDSFFVWQGSKYDVSQVLEFPRFFYRGNLLNGILPNDVKISTIYILIADLKHEAFYNSIELSKLGFSDMSGEISLKNKGIKEYPENIYNLLVRYSILKDSLEV